MITHILLPTDFSPSARTAADFAADLALRYDATIDVVHAWTPPPDVDELLGWLTGQDDETRPVDIADFVEARCGPLLRALLANLEAKNVREPRGRLETGQPSQVILDLVESDRYDLVVMASHGRTGLADVLLGSCVERVVRRSPVPVLVVPIPRDDLRADPWREEERDGEDWISLPAQVV